MSALGADPHRECAPALLGGRALARRYVNSYATQKETKARIVRANARFIDRKVGSDGRTDWYGPNQATKSGPITIEMLNNTRAQTIGEIGVLRFARQVGKTYGASQNTSSAGIASGIDRDQGANA